MIKVGNTLRFNYNNKERQVKVENINTVQVWNGQKNVVRFTGWDSIAGGYRTFLTYRVLPSTMRLVS